MSFAPHETETSEDAVERAHGNVVTFGCGLGYFPYMVSEKENVSSVTIVEFDQKIIDFFKEKGIARNYVASVNSSRQVVKSGKEYKISTIVTVNKEALHKDLETAGIIKGLNSGF